MTNKTEIVAATETSTELSAMGQYALVAVEASEAVQALSEALAPGETLELSDLPIVKVPTAGALNWQLPDGSATKNLNGVILARQPVRAYWNQSYDETGGGTPPDCSSVDLLTGIGDNGQEGTVHDCRACPWAQFGSARNAKGEAAGGQACRQITRLFLAMDGQRLPVMVALPPTSFRDARKFAIQNGLAQHEVDVTLVNDQSQGGIKYSKAAFAVNRVLEPDEKRAMYEYRQAFIPFISQVPVQAGLTADYEHYDDVRD
jgi:hypothetical protein